MLLDDIIDILSDSNGSLTEALLKSKILLHRKRLLSAVLTSLEADWAR
jgi:hypothetical protein